PSRLVEDCQGNAGLADIVQGGRQSEPLHVQIVESDLDRESDRHFRYQQASPFCAMLSMTCDVASSASSRFIGRPARTAENIDASAAAPSAISGEISEQGRC